MISTKMNLQQKYLASGTTIAIAIVALIKTWTTYGMDNTMWMILLSAIACVMICLVFNIFVLTQSLAPLKNGHNKTHTNKLQ